MEKLTGRPQRYAWGSRSAIPEMLGVAEGGEPYAEHWLGAHPSLPSLLEDETPLDAHLAENPHHLGATSRERFGDKLPYLLKLLAAEAPLSLQAHPSREEAEAGFARENEAKVPLDAPHRTYRDDWPKPEAIIALTEFDALCGFRSPRETAALFAGLQVPVSLDSILGPLTERSGAAALQEVFLDVLSLGDDRRHLVDEVVAAAVKHTNDDGPLGEFARTAVEVDEHFPSDPGILAALLLNRVRLRPLQALYLPAGNMHAYLKGTGVEVMANSDNVLRGGLTKKHIDVDELVRIVAFDPSEVRPIDTTDEGEHVVAYDTPAPEFRLWRCDLPDARCRVPGAGARIVLVTEGTLTLTGTDVLELRRGEAAFLTDADRDVTVEGRGQAFVAGPGV